MHDTSGNLTGGGTGDGVRAAPAGTRPTGIVLVSHSAELARAALSLVRGLLPGLEVPVRLAAGLEGGELGTDTTAVLAAVQELLDGAGGRCEGVLVLADLGSGVMSALTALELLEAADPEAAGRAALSPAPVVEGLMAAYAAAGTGQDFAAVQDAAERAAHDKRRAVTG